jgi:hypothetical protein
MMALASVLNVSAAEGFGASGPFAGYHYKLVQGESIEIPQIYVIFFNNYNTEINVQLSATVPDGVTIDLESDLITMEANSIMEVPVRITTADDAAAGDYVIGVAAEVIPDEINGIQIIGSAKLSARLSIYGEAGRYSIVTETTKGDPFEGDLTIYRKEDNNLLTPVGYSDDGTYSDRVIPGTYVAQVYYDGTKVVDYEFVINDGDDLDIVLVAKTVFITTFLVGPVFNDETELLQSAQIVYTIENIYEPINNARLMLVVERNGSPVDNIEILFTGYLGTGAFDGRYSYIPTNGWRAGDYSFKLEIYEDDIEKQDTFLHDETDTKIFTIDRDIVEPYLDVWDFVLYGAILILIIVIIFLLIYRKKDYTFIEKVERSNNFTKKAYYDLQEFLLENEQVQNQLSDDGDLYMIGRKKVAKFTMMKRTLEIHLRAKIEDYPQEVYNQKDYSHIKELRVVRFTISIKKEENIDRIKEVIINIFEETTKKED